MAVAGLEGGDDSTAENHFDNGNIRNADGELGGYLWLWFLCFHLSFSILMISA